MRATEIVTAAIAAYGAVLSTFNLVRQVVSGRVNVKLTVQKDMQLIGDEGSDSDTVVLMTATNVGSRPVTIRNMGAVRLCTRGRISSSELLFHECLVN
jgi:hypothetical protein